MNNYKLVADLKCCGNLNGCNNCGHNGHHPTCIRSLLRDAAAEIERLRETVEFVRTIEADCVKLAMENARLKQEAIDDEG